MSTSKEYIQIANQIPVLAKAYFNHLHGMPEEVAKQQKELLRYLKGLHRQLRVKGTQMVKVVKSGSGKAGKGKSFFEEDDYGCPGAMIKCPDGTCVGDSSHCGSESPLMGAPAKPAKKTAPAKKKSSGSKKKK